MITGLKVTIEGKELKQLCKSRAAYHEQRVAAYEQQIANFENAKVEGMPYTSGDPTRALRDKKSQHESEAGEMVFISEHVDVAESYLLDMADLQKLGICKSRY